MINKLYGHTDICIGTLNSGRTSAILQDQLGMFVKTLPLRTPVNPKWNFEELLHYIQESMMQLNKYQDLPEVLQSTIRYDLLLLLENPSFDYHEIQLSEKVQLNWHDLEAKYSRLPLIIHLNIKEGYLAGKIEYDQTCYDLATIAFIHLKFEKLLQECLNYSKERINQINIDLEIEQKNTIDITFGF